MRPSSAAAEDKALRGLWIPSTVADEELRTAEEEGLIYTGSWRSAAGHPTPAPIAGEHVHFLSHILRGISLPPSDFLLRVLEFYGVQLHNLPPNSILELSAFVALCEGYLGVRPSLTLFRYYFGIRKNSISAGVPYTTGTLSLSLRRGRVYPKICASESVKQWAGSFFYHKEIRTPNQKTTFPAFANGHAPHRPSWDAIAPEPTEFIIFAKRRIEYLMHNHGPRGTDLVHCWLENRIQPLQHRDKLMCELTAEMGDHIRISDQKLSSKEYNSRMQSFVKIRVERKVPEMVMPMYTAENPAPKVIFPQPCLFLVLSSSRSDFCSQLI